MVAQTRVAIYARVSTVDKGQDPETQLMALRAYAERRGFAIVGEYIDFASGTREDRPQYQALLEAARKRQLDVVDIIGFKCCHRSSVNQKPAAGDDKKRGDCASRMQSPSRDPRCRLW